MSRSPDSDQQLPTPRRLSPEMASFRALVFVFVRDYLTTNELSPSYGEIAAHFETSRTRVRNAIRALIKDGRLVRVAHERGLRLPDEEDEALRKLRELGWTGDSTEKVLSSPSSSEAEGQRRTVTIPPLLPPPALDYPSGSDAAEGGSENDRRPDRK